MAGFLGFEGWRSGVGKGGGKWVAGHPQQRNPSTRIMDEQPSCCSSQVLLSRRNRAIMMA
eukprot:5640335-Amphidinium_carterae.1